MASHEQRTEDPSLPRGMTGRSTCTGTNGTLETMQRREFVEAIAASLAGALSATQLAQLSQVDQQRRELLLLRIVELRVATFDEVDARFAYDEGEGDRSLDDWRAGHRRYWQRVAPGLCVGVLDDRDFGLRQQHVATGP